MNALEKFHENLDNSDYDITNSSEINRYLQAVSKELYEQGLTNILKLSELERQCYALRKSFNIEKGSNKPIGISWKMSGIGKTEDGKEAPIFWPDISQFTDTDFDYIEDRYKKIKNLFSKTQFGLILYFQKPTKFSRHNDFKEQLCIELFQLATSYEKKILKAKDQKYYFSHLHQMIKGALYIAITSKFDHLKKEIIVWVQNLHQRWGLNRRDVSRVLSDITRLILNNFKHVKDDVDIELIFERNLEGVEIKSKTDVLGAISILQASDQLDAKARLDYFNYKKREAEFYEQLADEAEGTTRQLAAISFVETALRLYREIKDQKNIKRLEKRYQKIRGTGKFGEFKEELDEESVKGMLENITKDVEQKNSIEILESLAFSPMLLHHKLIKEKSIETFEKSMSFRLFGSSVVDKFGNTVAKYSTEEERKHFSFLCTYDFHFQFSVKWLAYYFMEAYKKGKIDSKTTINFLKKSWVNKPLLRNYNDKLLEVRPIEILIPPIQLLFDELKRWIDNNEYKFNLVVLNDTLTLKIEALLRYMCEWAGIATFRPKDKGIMMEKNLDELLASIRNSDEKPTGFDEDDRLFIKFVLTEKKGRNLRNKIAHGLMDFQEYRFEDIIILLIIILRFGKYHFLGKQ